MTGVITTVSPRAVGEDADVIVPTMTVIDHRSRDDTRSNSRRPPRDDDHDHRRSEHDQSRGRNHDRGRDHNRGHDQGRGRDRGRDSGQHRDAHALNEGSDRSRSRSRDKDNCSSSRSDTRSWGSRGSGRSDGANLADYEAKNVP